MGHNKNFEANLGVVIHITLMAHRATTGSL